MKKIISILLLFVLIFSLSACNKSNNTSSELDAGVQSDISSIDISTQNTTTESYVQSTDENSKESETAIKDGNSKNTQTTPTTSDNSKKNETSNTSANTTTVETSSNENTISSTTSTIDPSQSTSSSVHPDEEICPKRSNDLPHRWKDKTCTSPKICEFCSKEYSSPLGHTFSRDGICDTCGTSVIPLIVEYNGSFMFDNITMNYVDYNYNTESNKITFYFDLISPDNVDIQEFFIKMIMYNGNTKLTTKNIGLVDRDSYYSKYVLLESTLTNETTKIILENLS